MPIIDSLITNSTLDTDESVEKFTSSLTEIRLSKNQTYIPPLLSCLSDDSESIDIMKEIIATAETFSPEDYISALLEVFFTIKDQAPEWLEYILYRITNSDKHLSTLRLKLKSHHNKQRIIEFLYDFLKKNPEKLDTLTEVIDGSKNKS